jgi:glycosyltransferase involved in cell wall biosynthesis
VVEAQACGCPVVCSNATSLPEVAGHAALMRSPDDEEGFVVDVLSLCNPAARDALIRLGHENVKRFTTGRMVADYIAAYRSLSTA